MIESAAVYFALILARVGTFVAVMPLFADRTPRLVRIGLALGLAVFYFSAVAPRWEPPAPGPGPGPAPTDWPFYALALLRESVIGAAMGFAFGLFLLPAKIAGQLVTQQIGLALSPQTAELSGQSGGSALGSVFETAAALVFLAMDGHHVMLAALHASFASLPLGGDLLPQPAGPALAGLARAQEMGVLLAAPLAACLFSLTVVLALMARAAPQLNIYSVGFALQVVVALLGVLFLLPDFVRLMAVIVSRTGEMVPAFLG